MAADLAKAYQPHSGEDRSSRYVIVDWDGTAVESAWPEQTRNFMPGFVEAMWRLHRAGLQPVIESSRFNPNDYVSQQPTERSIAQAHAERQYVRNTLDEAGLSFVLIHEQVGKPTGMVYIDDKAERYTGTKNAWSSVVDKVLIRAGLPLDTEDE